MKEKIVRVLLPVCLLVSVAAGCAYFVPSEICVAIVGGDVHRAIELVERGDDVNAANGCALVAAAGRAHLELVELLLDHGANPNRRATGDLSVVMGGSTPLEAAVQSRNSRVVQLLLERGSDPREDYESFNTVLNFGDVDMARLLLRHGANPNMTSPAGAQLYAYPDDKMVAVPRRDMEPDRIDETVRRLNCTVSILTGSTLLLRVVAGGYGPDGNDGRERIIPMLLDGGANVNARSYNGSTPLMEATSQHDHVAIALLLQAGADRNATDRCGSNALDYADLWPLHARAHLAPQTKALLERP